MSKLFYAAFAYLVLGVASGLFYREFTKANDFTDAQFTQLSVVHTHLLVLGFMVLLIVLILEAVRALSEQALLVVLLDLQRRTRFDSRHADRSRDAAGHRRRYQ